MNREDIIQEVEDSLHDLTRLHVQHRLDKTENFQRHKDRIARLIRQHDIDIRRELSAVSCSQYRRYFM